MAALAGPLVPLRSQKRSAAMLVLSRQEHQELVIDPRDCPFDEQGLIRIVLVGVCGNRVRLGVEAPAKVRVDRLEVYEQRQRELGGVFERRDNRIDASDREILAAHRQEQVA